MTEATTCDVDHYFLLKYSMEYTHQIDTRSLIYTREKRERERERDVTATVYPRRSCKNHIHRHASFRQIPCNLGSSRASGTAAAETAAAETAAAETAAAGTAAAGTAAAGTVTSP